MSTFDANVQKAVAHLIDRQIVLLACRGPGPHFLAQEAWRAAYFRAFALTEQGLVYWHNGFLASRLGHALLIEPPA